MDKLGNIKAVKKYYPACPAWGSEMDKQKLLHKIDTFIDMCHIENYDGDMEFSMDSEQAEMLRDIYMPHAAEIRDDVIAMFAEWAYVEDEILEALEISESEIEAVKRKNALAEEIARREKQRIHEKRMVSDPEYKERWEEAEKEAKTRMPPTHYNCRSTIAPGSFTTECRFAIMRHITISDMYDDLPLNIRYTEYRFLHCRDSSIVVRLLLYLHKIAERKGAPLSPEIPLPILFSAILDDRTKEIKP